MISRMQLKDLGFVQNPNPQVWELTDANADGYLRIQYQPKTTDCEIVYSLPNRIQRIAVGIESLEQLQALAFGLGLEMPIPVEEHSFAEYVH